MPGTPGQAHTRHEGSGLQVSSCRSCPGDPIRRTVDFRYRPRWDPLPADQALASDVRSRCAVRVPAGRDSARHGVPVALQCVTVSLNTLYPTMGSMAVTLLIAIPIALYSSRQGHSAFVSWPWTMMGYVLSSLPLFWLASIVIYVSVHYFNFFPLTTTTAQDSRWGMSTLVPILVLGLGSGTISEVIRFLREEMNRVMAEDYIRTARAKGASVWRHAFKEGLLLPVSEIVAAKIPFSLGGAVIVEQIFNWPGMGRMAWQAAQDRDFPVIMGIALMAALFVRMGSLVQRMIYIAVNPQGARD